MILATLLMTCSPVASYAASVYPGCAVPAPSGGHRTFYVDPAKGSAKGDGSAAKPWRTLAEVVAGNLIHTKGHNSRTWSKGDTSLIDVNANGPIGAGDVIMLMSGDHGSVTISNAFNTDFITVLAGPGQTPVMDRLSLVSSSKWAFQGVKFQGRAPADNKRVDGIVNVGSGDWLGSTQNIVFDNDSFSAADDTSSWSSQDWLTVPYNYALFTGSGTSCVSLTNSHVYNVMNAINLAASNSIVQSNTIEKMFNDGIDMMASNLLIKGNSIRNGTNNAATSTLHADAIQGWSLSNSGKPIENKNVVIDSNSILKTGSASQSYLQGITIFDGVWDGVSIINNAILTNAPQAISISGVANSSIINNTIQASDGTSGVWILVGKSKSGAPSTNVVVRNNITPALQIQSPGVTLDHNIVTSNVAILQSNNTVTRLTSGSYGSNKIMPNMQSQFVSFNAATGSYDLRPRSGSPAIGFGIATQAPPVDILSKARKPTVDAGAYN